MHFLLFCYQKVIIKLADFGFAKIDRGDLVTPQFTPYYVSPQVLYQVNILIFFLSQSNPTILGKTLGNTSVFLVSVEAHIRVKGTSSPPFPHPINVVCVCIKAMFRGGGEKTTIDTCNKHTIFLLKCPKDVWQRLFVWSLTNP